MASRYKRMNIHVKRISTKIAMTMMDDATYMMLKVPLVRKDSWRKPRGVVNVVSAFGNKKNQKKEGKRQKELASKKKGSGHLANEERSLGGGVPKKGEQSPGILRTHDEAGRRPGTGNSGVRFSTKNEVKLIQVKPEIGVGVGAGGARGQPVRKRTRSTNPGEMRRQSRNILNNMNRKHEAKLRQAAASGYDSESSYHSECGHKSPNRRRATGKGGTHAGKKYGESKGKFRRRTTGQNETRLENETEADYERRMRCGENGESQSQLGTSSKLLSKKGMKAKSPGAATMRT